MPLRAFSFFLFVLPLCRAQMSVLLGAGGARALVSDEDAYALLLAGAHGHKRMGTTHTRRPHRP
jgi:hypothetical protein